MSQLTDWTLGGIKPVAQDDFQNDQQGVRDMIIKALAGMGVSGSTPVLLWGMNITIPSGGHKEVSEGWFVYNGDIVRCPGNIYTDGLLGTVDLVTIGDTPTIETYYDGSTPEGMHNYTASMSMAASVTDATHFPLSAMVTWASLFGSNNRDSAWSSIAVATGATHGTIVGSLYYMKDNLTNMLMLRSAALQTQSSGDFVIGVPTLIATLPVGYRPAATQYFNVNVDGVAPLTNWPVDFYVNTQNITQLNGWIDTFGRVYIHFRKEATSSYYNGYFNVILPLY